MVKSNQMDTSKKSLSQQIEEQFREQAEARRCVEARIGAQNNYLAMIKDSTTGKSLEEERIDALKRTKGKACCSQLVNQSEVQSF
ncbi:hypothetical protein RHMOL_Rhmol08G0232100 [Rhododendron molle]|uniref:Uncharacterized protein n=1 Tax=Rhododendron molle TaxID=49168 RepID=A0ACC0MSY2_RHOML|nr:hypothetical protein RHMOL_Rhmol08G0232100 [Rhododendron molle]